MAGAARMRARVQAIHWHAHAGAQHGAPGCQSRLVRSFRLVAGPMRVTAPPVLARQPASPSLTSSRGAHDGSVLADEMPSLGARFLVTAEVCVSKIGPAGAGWWAANALASESLGLSATDMGYFVTTGLGDASAVWLGHSVYFFLKSLVMPGISMSKEFQTATFLGGATFLSGFVWQPACNAMEAEPFLYAAVGVGTACGSAFFVGLRGMRLGMHSAGFSAVEHPTSENLRDDAVYTHYATNVAYPPILTHCKRYTGTLCLHCRRDGNIRWCCGCICRQSFYRHTYRYSGNRFHPQRMLLVRTGHMPRLRHDAELAKSALQTRCQLDRRRARRWNVQDRLRWTSQSKGLQ